MSSLKTTDDSFQITVNQSKNELAFRNEMKFTVVLMITYEIIQSVYANETFAKRRTKIRNSVSKLGSYLNERESEMESDLYYFLHLSKQARTLAHSGCKRRIDNFYGDREVGGRSVNSIRKTKDKYETELKWLSIPRRDDRREHGH